MREQFRPVRINFAPVDITGGPGLAVVAVIVAIAFEFPETRWLLLAGIVCGALLDAAMILFRRRSHSGGGENAPPDALASVLSLRGSGRGALDDGQRHLRRILSGMMHDVVGNHAV